MKIIDELWLDSSEIVLCQDRFPKGLPKGNPSRTSAASSELGTRLTPSICSWFWMEFKLFASDSIRLLQVTESSKGAKSDQICQRSSSLLRHEVWQTQHSSQFNFAWGQIAAFLRRWPDSAKISARRRVEDPPLWKHVRVPADDADVQMMQRFGTLCNHTRRYSKHIHPVVPHGSSPCSPCDLSSKARKSTRAMPCGVAPASARSAPAWSRWSPRYGSTQSRKRVGIGKSTGNPLEIHSDVDGMEKYGEIWRNMVGYGGIGFSCFKPLDQPLWGIACRTMAHSELHKISIRMKPEEHDIELPSRNYIYITIYINKYIYIYQSI